MIPPFAPLSLRQFPRRPSLSVWGSSLRDILVVPLRQLRKCLVYTVGSSLSPVRHTVNAIRGPVKFSRNVVLAGFVRRTTVATCRCISCPWIVFRPMLHRSPMFSRVVSHVSKRAINERFSCLFSYTVMNVDEQCASRRTACSVSTSMYYSLSACFINHI